MSNRNTNAILKALFAVIVWGASFIATKIALREASPMFIVWIRFGIGVIILAFYAAARKEFELISLKDLGYFALLGFLGITFHQWLQANGLLTAQATTTAWIVATIPVFIALLGWAVLKERLGFMHVLGIVVAALGVLLVVTRGDLHSLTHGEFGTRGDILVLISAPNWAVFSVLSRRSLKNHSPTNMMLYVMFCGWIFTTVVMLAEGYFFGAAHTISFGDAASRLSQSGWIAILFLGVFCSGFAYIFWYDALKQIQAARLGTLLYIEPIVAVVVAAIFLYEVLLWATILGGGLILLGVWIVNRPSKKAD